MSLEIIFREALMEIFVLGINYKTAPIEIREKLSIPSHKTSEILGEISEKTKIREKLILSTCNRTEIYGVCPNAAPVIEEAKNLLSRFSSLRRDEFEDKLYIYRQPQSVQHLFSVASGLDSMVVGETEIIGQVKDAYLEAHKNRQTGKILNNLFQRSLKVAKNLRTQTEIGAGHVSVASVAVELAEKIFDRLKEVRVMILGTGEMASSVAKAMSSRGACLLIASANHMDLAVKMSGELGGEAVAYADLDRHMKSADILIGSIFSERAGVTKDHVSRWMKARHEKPLFMIDVAVPRNIDPAVGSMDNVYLYNIDDLKEITEKNIAFRESQTEKCAELVLLQTQHFMSWLNKEFTEKIGVRP